jgi:hypothetical protein
MVLTGSHAAKCGTSEDAASLGLAESMFARLAGAGVVPSLLDTQARAPLF